MQKLCIVLITVPPCHPVLISQGQPGQPLHLHEHAHLDRGYQRNPVEEFSSFQPQVRSRHECMRIGFPRI